MTKGSVFLFKNHRGPISVCTGGRELQTQLLCLAFEQGTVGFIETAEDEGSARLHDPYEVRHICQKDVAVDVGKDNIELSTEIIEHGAVATERLQAIVYVVDNGIMARVVSTPLVYIVAYAGVGSQLQRAYA